jgi:hypothetical protein
MTEADVRADLALLLRLLRWTAVVVAIVMIGRMVWI